jgi:hypothetical protein
LYDISSKQQEKIQESSVSTVTRLNVGLRDLGLILGRERDFTLMHSANIGRMADDVFCKMDV